MGGAQRTAISLTIQDDGIAAINTNIVNNTSSINTNIDNSRILVNRNVDNSRTVTNANIDSSTTSINNRIDNALTEIIAVGSENTGQILTLVQLLADNALRRDIQTNLGNKQCEAWMYTPEFLEQDERLIDASLEVVFDVVQTVIFNARDIRSLSGKQLNRAQSDLDHARRLPIAQTQQICTSVLKAYETATVRPY
jgi:hypothetical protein